LVLTSALSVDQVPFEFVFGVQLDHSCRLKVFQLTA